MACRLLVQAGEGNAGGGPAANACQLYRNDDSPGYSQRMHFTAKSATTAGPTGSARPCWCGSRVSQGKRLLASMIKPWEFFEASDHICGGSEGCVCCVCCEVLVCTSSRAFFCISITQRHGCDLLPSLSNHPRGASGSWACGCFALLPSLAKIGGNFKPGPCPSCEEHSRRPLRALTCMRGLLSAACGTDCGVSPPVSTSGLVSILRAQDAS